MPFWARFCVPDPFVCPKLDDRHEFTQPPVELFADPDRRPSSAHIERDM